MTPKAASANPNLTFAFDIGHSSIGWAVLREGQKFDLSTLQVVAAGTVLFQKDGCLASSRRANRRTRRTIAARRARIANLSAYLEKLGVLTPAQLRANPTSAPWLLAARVLASNGERKLSWPELWAVLRWYAHNRGYDGNALWANDDAAPATDAEEAEDTEKVENARKLLEQFGKNSMAETMCAFLGLDPLGAKQASARYFKGQKAAFPRDVVIAEVRRILEAHKGVLPKLDDDAIRALLEAAPNHKRTFRGGLLFGQKVPRFDNRLIPQCRITGKNTPNKSSQAFLLYRWGRLLNNLVVFDPAANASRALTPEERRKLHAKMLAEGYFDKRSLNRAILEASGCEPFNTESYFMTEEMEEALVLDPVKKLMATNQILKAIWPLLPDAARLWAETLLRKRRPLTADMIFAKVQELGGDPAPARAALAAPRGRGRSRTRATTPPEKKRLLASFPSGRAAYASPVLRQAFEQCLAGIDPASPEGCLYETPAIRERLLAKAGNVDRLTNNHLVRHRLHIFRRLLSQMVDEFAGGDKTRIDNVVVEVVRELQTFSGLDSQAMARKLNEKLGNFRMVAKELEQEAAAAGVLVTGSLIRKARILVDQGFRCPYTGKPVSWNELFTGQLEIEHIIPRSLRPSDALSSCVLTFRAVNDMKGQRTAAQFIKECQGQPVPGMENLHVATRQCFEDIVQSIKSPDRRYRPSEDDRKRCRRRAELLLLENYDQRNADFSDRDLTQTSHLNKLAIRLVRHDLGIDAIHVPGSVTGFLRPKFSLDSCLFAAVPRIQAEQQKRRAQAAERLGIRLDEGDLPEDLEERLTSASRLVKQEVRDLTHLHHAMDAITQALSFLLFDPADWKILLKRHIPERERQRLRAKYPILAFSQSGDLSIPALPPALLQSAVGALEQKRVVQHVPSRMHGISVEQTTWRILDASNPDQVKLDQQTRDAQTGRLSRKTATEKASLLLGGPAAPDNSKLKAIKGAVKIDANWGLALDPEPVIIPYFKVFPRLRELRQQNHNRPVRVLRKGNLIRVAEGTLQGTWKILSIKSTRDFGLCLDLITADNPKDARADRQEYRANIALRRLLQAGLTILKPTLTGVCPTT